MLYAVLITLVVLLLAIVAFAYLRDRRALKRPTVSSIGKNLWEEIDLERRSEIEKGKKFRKALDEAKRKD